MAFFGEPSTAHQQTSIARPTDPGPRLSRVHNLDAKFFLNRPMEDLIPAKYLRRAEHTCKFKLSGHSPSQWSRPKLHPELYPRSSHVDYSFILTLPPTASVQRKPWIFRGSVEDARDVDQTEWSKVDIRYRGVFKTLAKVPTFSKGLWDGGSEEHMMKADFGSLRSQGQVIYALMGEVADMVDLQRPTREGDAIFFLK